MPSRFKAPSRTWTTASVMNNLAQSGGMNGWPQECPECGNLAMGLFRKPSYWNQQHNGKAEVLYCCRKCIDKKD